jgi:drug/metabolite transporter (DMT)-like permease
VNPSSIGRAGGTVGLGILLMVLGDFLFASNDVLGKWLVGTFSVGQVLLIRSAAALVVMVPMVMHLGVRNLFVGLEKPRTQVLRVLFATFEVVCFYWAVVYLPVADVMVFYLAGPIYVAALSPWMLGESVGRRRWIAIRVQPSPFEFGLLCMVGAVAMVAHVLINRSLKYAPAAVVAPIHYTLLLWAVIFGYLVFGDVPQPAMLAGAAIIIAAGLFLFSRERVRAVPPSPPADLV